MLDAEWTGRRIVVRRAIRAPAATDGAHRTYQDVLGDLLALDEDELTIETRTGRVEVARSEVASARLVLPAARDVLALEATSSRGWRAREVDTSSDGWLLRADFGWTGRANSALAVRTVRRPLDHVLAEVTAWYAERGLPARIQIPHTTTTTNAAGATAATDAADGPDNALSRALAHRGWTAADHTDVLVTRLDLLAARTGEPVHQAVDVRLDPRPDAEWLAVYHYRGRASLPAGAADLLGRHDRVVFARVELDGVVAAIGRGAVDDGWLGITALDVAASHRRHGLATAVVGALGRWASSTSTGAGERTGADEHTGAGERTGAGARRAYVQTDQTNAQAQRFFGQLGFYQHHSYLYRSAPTIN